MPDWSGASGVLVAARGDTAATDNTSGRVLFGPVGVVFGAIWVAVLAMLVLHLYGAGRLDPATTTVSDYVSLPGGFALLTIATLAIAVATAVVPVGLLLARLPNITGLCVLFWLGCAGLLASIAFPTNTVGAAESLDTVLHRYAAGLFFVSLPVAAIILVRRLPSRPLALLTACSVLAGIAFVASHIPLVLPELPGAHLIAAALPRGIAERVLLATDLLLLAGLVRRVGR